VAVVGEEPHEAISGTDRQLSALCSSLHNRPIYGIRRISQATGAAHKLLIEGVFCLAPKILRTEVFNFLCVYFKTNILAWLRSSLLSGIYID
jgi:hypothetical protein